MRQPARAGVQCGKARRSGACTERASASYAGCAAAMQRVFWVDSVMMEQPFGLFEQLASANRVINLGRPKRPPSKPGGIRYSSAADDVIEYLRSEMVFRRQCEVREALRMSHPSAAWALLCLRMQGLVDVIPDGSRNPRYLRYRART